MNVREKGKKAKGPKGRAEMGFPAAARLQVNGARVSSLGVWAFPDCLPLLPLFFFFFLFVLSYLFTMYMRCELTARRSGERRPNEADAMSGGSD